MYIKQVDRKFLTSNFYLRVHYRNVYLLLSRVSQLSDVDLIAKETDCLPNYIRKGIAMACFFYARCLHEGHGIQADGEGAKKLYSRVCIWIYTHKKHA